MSTTGQPTENRQRRGFAGRAGTVALWYVLPALAVLVVIGYVVAAIVLDVNPPVVPVDGVSMRPALHAGDLVLLEGVTPSQLHKGDVIAFHVPKSSQQQYHLPGSLVHRIIRISRTDAGLIFQTKGDANSGPDVFKLHSSDIVGKMAGHVPGLGYPILFFRSTQGEIFLGAVALVAIVYFLIGVFEERHDYTAGTAAGLQAILHQTEELKHALARNAAPTGSGRAPPPRGFGDRGGHATDDRIDELVAAIGEYGEHLRSHTAVMQALAATTSHLEDTTSRLAGAVASPAAGGGGRATVSQLLAELRAPSLTRSYRGYSVDEVRRLLSQAAEALEETALERERLRSRLEDAEQQPVPPSGDGLHPSNPWLRRVVGRARKPRR